MNRDHLPRPTGAAAGNHTAPRKHAPARQCRHPTGRLQRDRSIAADLQAQVRRSPHAQCGTPLRSAFRCTPEQRNLHTRAAQSSHPSSAIFTPRQRNLSDRPSLRTDCRFGRTALMNSPTRPAARRSNNPPLRAACCSRPLGQIPVFWQLAVSAGAPHTASADTIRQTATPSAPRAPDRRRPRAPGPWRRRRRAASSPPWQEDRNPPRSRRTQRRRA